MRAQCLEMKVSSSVFDIMLGTIGGIVGKFSAQLTSSERVRRKKLPKNVKKR